VSGQQASRTSRGLRAPALSGALGVSCAALLAVRDPHDSGSYGFCPFLSLTGLPCPGCGGLRAVNDLTRGDLVAALSSNALAVVLVLGAVGAWIVWTARRATGRPDLRVSVGVRTLVLVVAAVAVFGVLRTTAAGSWLAP
jgi:hypothetical protein